MLTVITTVINTESILQNNSVVTCQYVGLVENGFNFYKL